MAYRNHKEKTLSLTSFHDPLKIKFLKLFQFSDSASIPDSLIKSAALLLFCKKVLIMFLMKILITKVL